MAQVRDTFQPASPRSSSGGEESYKHEGTPDTRLTAFSPNDERLMRSDKIIKPLNLGAPSELQPVYFPVKPAGLYPGVPVQTGKDPFVINTNAATKAEQKLSPTASAFRPVFTPFISRGPTHDFLDQAAAYGLDLLRSPHHSNSNHGTSSQASRCVVLFSRDKNSVISIVDAENFLLRLKQLGSACQGNRQLYDGGNKVYIHFKNIRDAYMVHGNVQLGGQDWCAEYISPAELYQLFHPGSRVNAVTEGQVYILAIPPPGMGLGPLQIEMLLCRALGIEGELISFNRQQDSGDNAFRAMVEFADLDAASHAVSTYNGANMNGIHMILSLNKHDIPAHIHGADMMAPSVPTPVLSDINTMIQNMSITKTPQPVGALVTAGRAVPASTGMPFPSQLPMYPMICNGQLPPGTHYLVNQFVARGQNATPLPASFGHLYTGLPPAPVPAAHNSHPGVRAMQVYNGRMDPRRQTAARVNRSTYYNVAGHHNHVDVGRIREGIDVRTTIMLRNIPNKVDQVMLKRIVDESSWGKYDFMYLRIDFANDCNVGYAFINFVDPLDIIDFVNARGNQRWNCFKSDKVAEISYATIQGKDCLVQKFRNSSVMLEPPHYRPKLYYTTNGPTPEMAGQEEQFPEPDNQSKMKRSCENAEHVGLFTPNAGQHFRDEQRRRRSQYDRGTRLAALEECDYDNRMQQPGLYLGH